MHEGEVPSANKLNPTACDEWWTAFGKHSLDVSEVLQRSLLNTVVDRQDAKLSGMMLHLFSASIVELMHVVHYLHCPITVNLG